MRKEEEGGRIRGEKEGEKSGHSSRGRKRSSNRENNSWGKAEAERAQVEAAEAKA